MISKVLIVLAVGAIGLFVVVATRPSEYRVSRTATIGAPPAVVFAHVNDFHRWNAWNPWAQIDPAMKQSYDGAPAGRGAIYTWAGNREVGEGRMTLTESRPAERIRIDMQFIKPFAGTSVATFTFRPAGDDRTIVTWTMEGQANFIAKAIHLFIDMDAMIGGNFDKGLAQMKSVVEAARRDV